MEYCNVHLKIAAPNSPSVGSMNGDVVFTPDNERGSVWSEGDTIFPSAPVRCKISNGSLMYNGNYNVRLMAGGGGVNPEKVYWRVAFGNMMLGEEQVQIDPFVFEAIPGEDIDLARVTPVMGYTPPEVIQRGVGLKFLGVLDSASDLPSNPNQGDAYFNIANKSLFIWKGSKWEEIEDFVSVNGVLELLAQEVAEVSTALDDKTRFLHRTVQAESVSRVEAVQEVPSSPDPTTLYLVLAPINTVELKESDWSSTYRVKVALEEGQEAPYYNGKVLSESFIGAPNGWHTWGEQELAVPKDGRYKIRTTATPATGWVTISTYDQAAASSGVLNWALGSVVELVADLKAGDLVYAYATSYEFTGETTITTNISETTDPLTDNSANDDPKALPTMRYRLSGTMGATAEMPSAEAPMIGEFVSGSSNWFVDGGESHGLTPLHSSEPLQWEVTVESSKNVGAIGFYIYDGATKKFRETEYVLGQTYTSIVALNDSDVLYPFLDTGGTLTGDIQLTVTAKAVV